MLAVNERRSFELDGDVRHVLAVVTATVRPQLLYLYCWLCCLSSQRQFVVVTLCTQQAVVVVPSSTYGWLAGSALIFTVNLP
jgi:hypothetical protein